MNELEEDAHWLTSREQYVTTHEKDKIIIFERGSRLFVFNFHPTKSFEHYRVGTKWPYEHIIEMDSDEKRFHGHSRLAHGHDNPFPIMESPWMGRPNYIQMYIPSRVAIVVKPLINDDDRRKYGLKTFEEMRVMTPPKDQETVEEQKYDIGLTAKVEVMILQDKDVAASLEETKEGNPETIQQADIEVTVAHRENLDDPETSHPKSEMH